VRPGWRVLDAGTGTGLIATLAAPRAGKSGRVIGIDHADQMLAVAREKATRFGFTQCEFRHGDLEALDFEDAQFNAAFAQFALHHVEPKQALHELQRVLMPGGALAIHEWMESPHTPNQILFTTLEKFRVDKPNDMLARVRAQSERALHFRVEFAKPEAMDKALTEAGFGKVTIHEEEYLVRVTNADAFLALASAAPLLYAELSALSAETRARFIDEARANLKSFETVNGFEWTYRAMAVRAQRAA
jgi:ubiquinone/menaquinone biosynthesis C-methylase UbiE